MVSMALSKNSTACGFVLMHWAQVHLDLQFSVQVTVQEGHQLITDGPYKLIRHPRYLGIILFSSGIALVFRSWATLVLVALILAVLLWRIHDEESLMGEEFGADWEAYCLRTSRLIPWLY